MKNYLFYLSILLFFHSCETKQYNSLYNSILRTYPSEFTDHFPKKTTNAVIHQTNNPNLDVIRLFLKKNDTTDNFNKLKDSLEKISLAKYFAYDTCLFIVNKFTTEQNYSVEKKANKDEIYKYLKKECLRNKLPIVNFWGLYEENFRTLPQLPDDFVIYVLEARKGFFWDAKYRSSGEYMPDFWKHGYSKGVAINDKTNEIIYWFVLW